MTTLCQPKVRVRQCDLFFFTSLCSAADLAAVSRRTNDAVPCGVVIMHSGGKTVGSKCTDEWPDTDEVIHTLQESVDPRNWRKCRPVGDMGRSCSQRLRLFLLEKLD